MIWQKAVFIILVLFCLSPWGSPPIALALGLILAFTIKNPFPELGGKPTKYLLQASVVLLGFGMNLTAVMKAGKDGILLTIVTIFGTLILGFAGRQNPQDQLEKTSALISSGTAICGGSAIAAVAPAINAESRRNIGVSRHCLRAQFGRTFPVSVHRPRADLIAKPIRRMGRDRDPRHEFGCRRARYIRQPKPCHRDDRQARAGPLDSPDRVDVCVYLSR